MRYRHAALKQEPLCVSRPFSLAHSSRSARCRCITPPLLAPPHHDTYNTHTQLTAMRRCSLLCRGALPLPPGGPGTFIHGRNSQHACAAALSLPRVCAFSTTTPPHEPELVRLRVDAHIATITLHNPAKLNPLTVKCRERLGGGGGGERNKRHLKGSSLLPLFLPSAPASPHTTNKRRNSAPNFRPWCRKLWRTSAGTSVASC